MTELEEKEIVEHDYITVDGEVPEPASSFNEKYLKRVGYVIAAIVGIVVFFIVRFH